MTAVGAEPNLNLSPEFGTDRLRPAASPLLPAAASPLLPAAAAPLLPAAETPRPQVAPWAAALASGGLTLAGVVGSAALVPDNDAGLWLAAASVWLLPGVGSVAVGANHWAGAMWAARTIGLGMMIPGVTMLRGRSVGPLARDEIMVMMVFGAITVAAGLVADIMGAYSFAQKIRSDGLVLRF